MQHLDDGTIGVVQWVAPLRRQAVKSDQSNRNRGASLSPAGGSSAGRPPVQNADDQDRTQTQTSQREDDGERQSAGTDLQKSIDQAVCRTICIFVEQHINDLKEQQKSINEARAGLVRDLSKQADDSNSKAHKDVSKLKVRDEQTKAIETIQQLTNYLRELTYLNRQIVENKDLVSEKIGNRLSDARNDIIQSLNDFVLSNGDIEVPIHDTDVANCRDYDLCIDAPVPCGRLETSQGGSSLRSSCKTPGQPRQPLILLNDSESIEPPHESPSNQEQQMVSHEDDKYVQLERRRREIQKLEKDTEELRRLFADFYTLVRNQGERVDSIENNIIMASHQVNKAKHHLGAPVKRLSMLVPVTGCITGALIGGPIGFIVGSKMGGITIVCASTLLGFLSSLGAQRCIRGGKSCGF